MRWVKFFLSLFLTLVLVGFLMFPIGPATFSMGAFLDPFHGFWENAESTSYTNEGELELPELSAPAKVVFDERRVPHIFADNMKDLAYVQGYVTARDRLWQMEFQVFAAAGRLTELIGAGPDSAVLNMDRTARRKGIVFAAERAEEQYMSDAETREVMLAYTAGINAYIDQLSWDEIPVEYKLLNYKPEPWTILKCALLQKYMADDLTTGADDLEDSHALRIWGRRMFDVLYPEFPYTEAPIVPAETQWAGYMTPPPVPSAYRPDSLILAASMIGKPNPDNGSNNWAVAGSRSATGRPILANDPHLGLNLPAIWYEVQLQTRDMNVYGVSLPGAPGVILGFNDSIAWGVTNGSQDVMDFYTVRFNDEKTHYLFDGQWLPIKEKRIEAHILKGSGTYFDTVYYTHMGPVMFDDSFGDQEIPLAVRWMAHEPSNESKTFLQLNRGRNYQDYEEAISHFQCPAMNFVFASAAGDIAIWQRGKFVNKWNEQGKFVMDGSRKDHMWNSFIPWFQNPHVINPASGYVSSANQHPTSRDYPYYYTGNFNVSRGRRIQQLLANDPSITIDDMKSFQLDNYGYRAADVLPTLLADLDSTTLTGDRLEVYNQLKNWNYFYDRDKVAPTLYERWWRELYISIWADEFRQIEVSVDWPSSTTTIGILLDSTTFSFYRDVKEGKDYDRKALVNLSFDRMVEKLTKTFPDLQDWNWGERKTTDVRHLTRVLRPFGKLGVITDGNGDILNATGRTHGPSWRMVVALGPEIEAYGIYPGGQSGHPGSDNYDAFVDDWAEGKYYRLWMMKSPDDTRREISGVETFTKSSD